MNNSNEEELDKLPIVDYTELPSEIREAIELKPYVIEAKAKLTWDGRQFIVRIPTEISKEMRITKENRMRFNLKKPLPKSDEDIELKIELI